MCANKKSSLLRQIRDFFQRDMWQMSTDGKSWMLRYAVFALRVFALVIDGFRRNRCSLHASALTLFSMMSLVPVLVLVLALARAFGGAELAREQLEKHINAMVENVEQNAVVADNAGAESADDQPQPSMGFDFGSQVREISNKIFDQVNTIDFGKLGGAGAILLLWSVIGVLGKVEASFNQLWGVDKPRPLVRKFTEYLAVIIILPFLVIAVSTVPVVQTVSSVMEQTMGERASSGIMTLLNSNLLRVLMSLVGGTVTFAFLLGFMPNERVGVVPALAGGFVTLILFVIWMKLCAMLQIGIAKYSALYGGFAVLPILLLWVYTSWQIILLGAEISFAVQNRDTYMLEQFADQASMRARLLMAVTLCVESVRATHGDAGGVFNAQQFAQVNGVPHRFIAMILDQLVEQRLLAEVADHPDEYLPCKSGEVLKVIDIVTTLMDNGEAIESLGLEKLGDTVAELSRKWTDAEKKVLSVTLDQLCV
jgi:membrane protein